MKICQEVYGKLGIVVGLITGRDGETRVASVRTHTKPTIFKRPIKRLYPLEVHQSQIIETQPEPSRELDSSIVADDVVNPSPPARPQRKVNLLAKERIRLWTEELNSQN